MASITLGIHPLLGPPSSRFLPLFLFRQCVNSFVSKLICEITSGPLSFTFTDFVSYFICKVKR